MKLVIGAVAYLLVVAFILGAALAGLSSIERREAKEEGPVLAMSADERAAKRERALEEVRTDPNRVPVWIVPTPKYDYTPQPIDAPRHSPGVIGKDARGAMAKAGNGSGQRQERRKSATAPRENASRSPALVSSRRDNDPFFRD